MPRLCFAVVLSCLMFAAPAARATVYFLGSDVGIACVDRATGKVLWRRADTFRDPALAIEDGRLVVEERDPPRGRLKVVPRRDGTLPPVTPRKEYFDAATGDPVQAGSNGVDVAPLAKLARNLRTASGVELAFDAGETQHLETTDGTVLQPLEWFPRDVLVAGDVAIVTFGGAGEVYGWDVARGELAWEIDLRRHVRDLPARPRVDIALDRGRLLVAVDERILAFSLGETPRLLWKTALPRQRIREYDSAWTRFARDGKILFAVVYEDLFALRASDGKLLWRFDAGAHADPWPVVHDGRVFVRYREQAERYPLKASWRRRFEIRALRIERSREGWEVTPLYAVPRRARAWSHLHPAPASSETADTIVVTLRDFDGQSIAIDVTGAFARRNVAYVRFHGLYESAELHTGDRLRARATWW